ncbi:MAG: bifunctional 3-demethylubiquinone-9 3-methyltransferase/ 2-octaprenyl-6-hydroxy phenol methylase [Firmicutes bacterium ADurb.Bin419]|nr:MAG: bifunctional 3-demethylubiquinone-9 3-methyltransferase/ 2-octaprenyl-6-hydroxy phenol methylase [Firmicutes bacterium ADurb.Bin419]
MGIMNFFIKNKLDKNIAVVPLVPDKLDDMKWERPFEVLRQKWGEIPGGDINRVKSNELSSLNDNELLERWNDAVSKATEGEYFRVRGWYHLLYKDIFKGKKVMDVGSGFGIDALSFAKSGIDITCVDIVESNLDILKRLCKIMNLDNVKFLYLENLDSLKNLEYDYDVIWCQGSMINAPVSVMQIECAALLEHLPVGGRWIELAYPKERWIREGSMPLHEWGDKTDGGAPWMEWYDEEKLLGRLAPAEFNVTLSFNFFNNDFNWFDLVRRK